MDSLGDLLTRAFHSKKNHPPWFLGANVDITNFTKAANNLYSFKNWTGVIYPGIKGGQRVPDEDDQKVSFIVEALSPSFFKVQPKIDANGTLSLEPFPDRIGTSKIRVRAVDSEKMSSESRTFSVTFRIVSAAAAYPQIAIQGNEEVAVNENSGVTMFRYFAAVWPFSSAQSDSSNGLIASLSFDVTCTCNASCDACDIFTQPPTIDPDGTLSFEPAPGFYGAEKVQYRLVSSNGDATPWANLTIDVLYVNQAPSFSVLDGGNVRVEEDSPAYDKPLVYDITRGMWPEAAELGTHGGSAPSYRRNEDWQNWTFTLTLVTGSALMMSVPPSINTTGALSFTLAPDANGVNVYAITMTDSGGTERGGVATSVQVPLTITVDAVNDAPSFSIPDTLTFTEIFRDMLMTIPSFASPGVPGKAVSGALNEASQPLTFTLAFVSGNRNLFATTPQITQNLDLILPFAAYQHGNITYNVSVTDDGKVNNTGVNVSGSSLLTILIKNVNQAPTIGLPPVITLWRNTREVSPYNPPYMTVSYNCTCSPCPSAACLDVSLCCAALQPAGASTVVPAVARVSAGPYEFTQSVTFTVVAQSRQVFVNDNLVAGADLFVQAPIIHPNGTLELSLRPEATGTAALSVTLVDDGGKEIGGQDRSQKDVLIVMLAGYVQVIVQVDKATGPTAQVVREGISNAVFGSDLSTSNNEARIIFVSSKEKTGSSGAARRLLSADADAKASSRNLLSTVIELEMHVGAASTQDLVAISSSIQAATLQGVQIISTTMILTDGAQGEFPSSFDVPPNITVNESSLKSEVDVISNIRVGSTVLTPSGAREVLFTVRALRYKAPAQAASWTYSDGIGSLFYGRPYVVSTCEQACTAATLILNLTDLHGVVDLEIVMYEPRGGLEPLAAVNKTVQLIVTPVPDAPFVQPAYSTPGAMTFIEDGGPCDVPLCRAQTTLYNLSDVFGDFDLWYPQGDFLTVESSDATKVNATVLRDGNNTLLSITPQLHQHGVVTVTAVDAYALTSSPPLSVTVVHVNHAPYIRKSITDLVLPEDSEISTIDLSIYIHDVDVEDTITYEVESLTPVLMTASLPSLLSPQLQLHLTPNQNGNGSIFVQVSDNHGRNVSTIFNISLTPVPDPPFPVPDGIPANIWGYIQGKLCAPGDDPYSGLVQGLLSLDECKTACLANDYCTAITYYTGLPDRCFLNFDKCEIIDTVRTAAVHTRPPGIIVHENSEPLYVDVSAAFGDPDECSTIPYETTECTRENDNFTLTAESNTPIVSPSIVVNGTSRFLLLTFARDQHTYPPVHAVITLRATDTYNLQNNITLNVTILANNQPPYAVQGGVATLAQESTLRVPFYMTPPHLCPTDRVCLHDVDMVTDEDTFEFSVASDDAALVTAAIDVYTTVEGVKTACFGACKSWHAIQNKGTLLCQVSATSLWYQCQHDVILTGSKGGFGLGSVTITATDKEGTSAHAPLNISVHLKNMPPKLRFNVVNDTITLLETFDEELQYIANFVSVASFGSPQEDSCARPPIRSIDCRGDNSVGQRVTYRVVQISGNTNTMSLTPGITPEGVLSFATRAFINGVSRFSVFAHDNAGTAHGGQDLSEATNFTVVIQDVNFPPVFEFGSALNYSFPVPTLILSENSASNSSAGPGSPTVPYLPGQWRIPAFAQNIDAGGGGSERDQALTFIVTKVCRCPCIHIHHACVCICMPCVYMHSIAPGVPAHNRAPCKMVLQPRGCASAHAYMAHRMHRIALRFKPAFDRHI
jgi:hypothetical protein